MSYPDGYDGGYRFVLPRWTPTVRVLIIANVAIFLVTFFLAAFGAIDLATVFDHMGVRADFVLGRGWVWQIVTYMFLHGGVFHIFFNMLALYFFGTQTEQLLGRRRFLILYFGGGVLGGLAYCGTQFLAPQIAPAVGASAAVMAVLVVCAFYFPNQLVFFFFVPMPIKWLVALFVAIDLLGSIGASRSGVAHIAHLGGALYGFLFWRFSPAVRQFFDRLKGRRLEREARARVDEERRMDEILDKITREGFDSLSRGERQFLQEQSRRRRERGYRY